jgi:fido (protein-threonine AMPylation protein)
MIDPHLPVGDGQAELDDDERDGLRLSYITTRGQLNEAEQRAVEVRNLVADARFWIASSAPVDESVLRFHHQLVAIHPFPNGNGRHGRFAADYLAQALEAEELTWGARLATDPRTLRRRSVEALRAADAGDLDLLLRFART